MAPYIVYGSAQKDVLPGTSGLDLHERSAVLLKLLSDRAVPRVICAPSLYGKSVAAYQYSQLMSEGASTLWVRASDPRFLCDLDDGTLSARANESTALVVIDGVATLSVARRAALAQAVAALIAEGREVLLTTADAALADALMPSPVLIDASDLLLTADEVGLLDTRLADLSNQALRHCAPPILLDHANGHRRFIGSLVASAPATPADALGMLALIMGEGSLSAVADAFTREGGPALPPVSSGIDRLVPHAGIDRRSGRFEAFFLTVAERALLLRTHAEALASFFDADEQTFLAALCGALLDNGDRTLLERVLVTLFTPAERAAFLSVHRLPSSGEAPVNAAATPGEQPAFEAPALAPAHAAEDAGLVDVKMFGCFQLSRNGKIVPERGEVRRKARILIALLVVNHDKELPRSWIEHTMWPTAAPDRARTSFYSLWSYVRRLLADTDAGVLSLRRSSDTISLRDLPVTSDVIVLDELCAALPSCEEAWECEDILRRIEGLYRGPLLPGVENSQIETYRRIYQNKVLDALVQGVDLLLRKGELRSALRFSSFAFRIDATREDVCYQSMKAQRMLGQLAGAISTFMRCRRALVERFGIDGSRRLDALYEEILHETSPSS